MRLPMVTIMQSGKAAGGKLNCVKEFMIIPSPGLSYGQVTIAYPLSSGTDNSRRIFPPKQHPIVRDNKLLICTNLL